MNSFLTIFLRIFKHKIVEWKIFLKAKRVPLRLVIGSAGIYEQGWLSTDLEFLNILILDNWRKYFKADSIDAILAEHVWEHLTLDEAHLAAKNCYQFLKPNGYIRVAVPDGFHKSLDYVNQVKPGGTGLGSESHKVLYNYKTLSRVFKAEGFDVDLIEYFDEKGCFQSKAWDPQKGFIRRSYRYDKRNDGEKANYTSIIIDAYKR